MTKDIEDIMNDVDYSLTSRCTLCRNSWRMSVSLSEQDIMSRKDDKVFNLSVFI